MSSLASPAPAPVVGAAATPGPFDRRLSSLVESLLGRDDRLEQALYDRAAQPDLVTRLLGLSLMGFTLFGVAMATLLQLAGRPLARLPHSAWNDGSALWLVLAYDLGLIAAVGVCLPSFYFFGLLAGVRTTMLDVVARSVHALAATATFLTGVLPAYVAVALGTIVFAAPSPLIQQVLCCGLLLPFIAGLHGVHTLYTGFLRLSAVRQAPARRVFLCRLMTAWCGLYTIVTPVMIWTLWTAFAGR